MRPRRVVVVGAGAAGVPLAARLSLAGIETVLIEAGGVADESTRAAAFGPAWTVRAGLPGGAHAWTYEALLQEGRPYRVARGRVVGGSSVVNGAYFQRPHPDDFARWAEMAGPDWSYEACLPALRRLERDLDFGADPVHGAQGPIPVQRVGAGEPLTTGFLAAAAALGAVPEPDKNAGGPSGAGLLPRNAIGGRRWDVARSYAPLLSGVELVADAEASRVLMRAGRAVGVEVTTRDGRRAVPADQIVLCAGAVETPRLLVASGVGVEPGADGPRWLPAGAGLSDHAAVTIAWSPRAVVRAPDLGAAWTAAWNAPGGAVSARAVEYLFAVLPTAAIITGDPGAMGPIELRIAMAEPGSRGTVAPRADPVALRYRHLSDAEDRRVLRDAVRLGARLLRADELGAAVATTDVDEVDLRDDDRADAWVAAHLGTALHACGTARMGDAGDPGSVVDAHGRVHGVPGLRIADTSILPVVPSRGTSLAAVMVGERVAELLLAE